MVATKNKAPSRKNTPTPQKKPLVVQYNKQASKAGISYVISENGYECLGDMGLDFSKYNKFKT